jgi:type IV pilus assembly protein PilC
MVFKFQAKAEDGRLVRGELEAGSEGEARVRLRAQKLTPIRLITAVDPKAKGGGFSLAMLTKKEKVNSKDLQVFTRQFAVLVSAGVPILQSLQAMSQGARSVAMTNCLMKVTAEVEKGRRLADAMALQPLVFDRLYVSLVRAGEESGALEAILNRLAEYIEKSVKLRNKIQGAMWYPAIILLVAFVVVGIIMVFVVPKIASMFTDSHQQLPFLTVMVMTISDFAVKYWYLLIATVIGIPVAIKTYYDSPEGRKVCDAIILGIPVMGTLVQRGSIARFSRTLATLLSAGVRIIDALDIAGATTGNYVLETAFGTAKAAISKGRPLAEPLSAIPYIPKMVSQMISIGEQTGNIDEMLNKVADFYDDEVENATAAMTSMIEPILMVVLGGIVAVIVIAMYLPLFNLAGAVGA